MKKFLIFLMFFLFYQAYGQTINKEQNYCHKQFILTLSGGVQMSGIKNEDFIRKNIAPVVSFGAGVWFTPEIALRFGYQGPYFNTIADDDRHHYSYVFGEVLLNINNIFTKKGLNNKWNLTIHPGAGYFYNYYYKRPNVCVHIGIMSSYKLCK